MLPSTPLSLALFASPALATAFSDLLPRNETANSTDKCHGEVDNIWDYANATTNLTIPGFTPPGFSPRNWTVNIGLRDSRDALRNTSQDQVTLWIDSPAEDDNLTSVDLPYIGCVVAFDMRQYKKSSGQGGEDGCKGVFSDKCYNALVSKAKSAAEAQSGETRERKTSLLCMDMARLDDESCDDSEVSVASSVTSELLCFSPLLLSLRSRGRSEGTDIVVEASSAMALSAASRVWQREVACARRAHSYRLGERVLTTITRPTNRWRQTLNPSCLLPG